MTMMTPYSTSYLKRACCIGRPVSIPTGQKNGKTRENDEKQERERDSSRKERERGKKNEPRCLRRKKCSSDDKIGRVACGGSGCRLRITFSLVVIGFLKKNQNAPRPSEHPPVMGKKCQNV